MNNQNSHNKIRLKIMVSGLFASFIALCIKKDKNLIIFNSFFNLKFNSNTKYLFLYFLRNRPETVKYVVNDATLRNELIKQYGNHFIETNSFKGKMYALKANTWFLNSYELPVGGLFQKYQRNVVCLSHGSPIKNEGTLEKKVSLVKRVYYVILRTNISYMLATDEDFGAVYQKYLNLDKQHIIISNLPQYDEFSEVHNKAEILNNDSFKVIYAPTWRHWGNPPLFDFPDFDANKLDSFLQEHNIKIYMRLHPNFGGELPDRIKFIKNIHEFSGSDFPDIMEYLNQFDALITDYSSISMDFLSLDRPMFFFVSDFEYYYKNIGFCVDFSHYTPGYKPAMFSEFLTNILDAKTVDSYSSERKNLIKECNCSVGDNSKRLVNLLIEKNILKE